VAVKTYRLLLPLNGYKALNFKISAFRNNLFTLALPILVATSIIIAWGSSPASDPANDESTTAEKPANALEIQTYTLQWKIAVGGLEYLNQQEATHGHSTMAQTFRTQTLAGIKEGLELAVKEHPNNPQFIRRILALSSYLKLTELQKELHSKLSQHAEADFEFAEVDQLLLKATSPTPASQPLTDDEYQSLERAFPWFAAVAASYSARNTEDSKRYQEQFSRVATGFFKKFMVGVAGGGLALLLSFIAGIYYLIRYFRKAFRSKFELSGMSASFCLEMFCIYLLLMLLVPNLIKGFVDLSTASTVLRLNVIVMLSLVLLTLWPTLFGVTRSQTARTLGLELGNKTWFFREILVGISFYLASLIPFLVILIAYQLLLQFLGVDLSEGAHPVVPLLTNSSDNSIVVWVVVLAVIAAPIIEEIMFRGAFYGWLRGRISPFWSILLSSVVFAAVHPQGPIGLLPLTYIGCLTAILREWRQSLIASMTLHACFNGATLTVVLVFLK
jgi:hypothetical protein